MGDKTVRDQRPKRSDSELSREQKSKKSDADSGRESKATNSEAVVETNKDKRSDSDAGQNLKNKKYDPVMGKNSKIKRSHSDVAQESKVKRSDSDVVKDSKGKLSDSNVVQNGRAKRSDSDSVEGSTPKSSVSDVVQDSKMKTSEELGAAGESTGKNSSFETGGEVQPKKAGSKDLVNVFTHSTTDFPGAWPEEDISVLLDAWEQAVEEPRPRYEPLKLAQSVLDILKEKSFHREVTRDNILKQMGQLENEYRTYLGLISCNVETVEGACVPQMERIMKKSPSSGRRFRKKKTISTGSNKTVSDADEVIAQDGPLPDEQKPGNRRVRFQQRQNLQRSVRAMIASQKTLADNFQLFFKKLDDSYGQIIHLLGEMVALQTIRHQTTLIE